MLTQVNMLDTVQQRHCPPGIHEWHAALTYANTTACIPTCMLVQSAATAEEGQKRSQDNIAERHRDFFEAWYTRFTTLLPSAPIRTI